MSIFETKPCTGYQILAHELYFVRACFSPKQIRVEDKQGITYLEGVY